METLRNFGTTTPGVVALAELAALPCSSQGDVTTEAPPGSGSAGGLAGTGTGGSGAAGGSSGMVGGAGGSGGRPASGEAGAAKSLSNRRWPQQ